jgi:hypothetical protein
MADRCICIITGLILAGSAIVLLTVQPDPLPPIDPERIRAAERLHLLALEAEVLKRELSAANRTADSLRALPRIQHKPNDETKRYNWNLSDSLSAVMALDILRANLPDTVRGEVGRVAQ